MGVLCSCSHYTLNKYDLLLIAWDSTLLDHILYKLYTLIGVEDLSCFKQA